MPPTLPRLGFGTVAIMQAVADGRQFGFDIMDATGLTSGTVYPALDRLEDLGYVKSHWEDDRIARDEARPTRRYFVLTRSGSAALREALSHPVLRGLRRAHARKAE